MACAGIGFGNKKSVLAIARRGGVDIVCNEVSNRATPTMVSFSSEERNLGEPAANFAAQLHKSTVSNIQRLLGVDPNSEFGKAEAARLTCPVIADPSGAGAAVQVNYNAGDGEQMLHTFSFQAIAAMYFTKLMEFASNEYKAPVKDCVISVPGYYTESQRRAVVDAGRIANINVQRVINENAAVALSYGIFRTKELPESDPIKVAFVDMGEAGTSVTVAAFTRSRCDILSSAFDPTLGGRNFDDLLVKKFATLWKTEKGIDAYSKPRAKLRIYKECEKLKRTLSANAQGFINIECFMNDIDVSGKMNRDEFEALAVPLLDRLKAVCEKAIADANLADDEKLFSVEIIGGSMRIPCVKKIVSDTFSPAPMRTTLNMDECIARGCALQSAMLSPAFRVRDYKVGDVSYFDINVEKMFASSDAVESMKLISKFDDTVPCLKAISFKPRGKLDLHIKYSDPSRLTQGPAAELIGSYAIDAPQDTEGRVKAKIRLNANGIMEVSEVNHHKEVEEMEEVEVKVEKKKETPAPDANGAPDDANMTDASPANGTADDSANGNVDTEAKPNEATADEGAKETKDAPAPMETEIIKEKRLVKKMKLMPVSFTRTSGPLSSLTEEGVRQAIEKEVKMRASDLYIKERGEARNMLEAYVYDARARIGDDGDLAEFGPSNVRYQLKELLDEAENWIYSDEGDMANKSTFTTKHSDLVDKVSPIVKRKKEFEERPININLLNATVESYKKLAVPGLEEYAHIEPEAKEKVLKCVEEATLWLKKEVAKQADLPKDVDPVLKCADIKSKREEVDKVCRPIEQTPKPKPKEEEKKEEAKDEEMKDTPSTDEKMETTEEAPESNKVDEKMEVDGEAATA